jgi:hypothetical protein
MGPRHRGIGDTSSRQLDVSQPSVITTTDENLMMAPPRRREVLLQYLDGHNSLALKLAARHPTCRHVTIQRRHTRCCGAVREDKG